MESLITIFREVRDPRDFNARHDLAAMLFIALAATLCGAQELRRHRRFRCGQRRESVRKSSTCPHGAPSHDSFSRVFRLLDPEEMAGVVRAVQGRACARRSGSRPAQGRRGGGRQEPAARLRARARLHAPAHDQRLGRRDAPVAGDPPCAGRRRDCRDPGGAENRDPEGLHRHRRRPALPSAPWPRRCARRGGHYAL